LTQFDKLVPHWTVINFLQLLQSNIELSSALRIYI